MLEQIDPTTAAVLAAAAAWGVGWFVKKTEQRNQWQDKLVLMAMAAAGAYALRQFEGRGQLQDNQAVYLAGIEGRFEERFTTIFNVLGELKNTLRDVMSEIRSHDRMFTGVTPPPNARPT